MSESSGASTTTTYSDIGRQMQQVGQHSERRTKVRLGTCAQHVEQHHQHYHLHPSIERARESEWMSENDIE